MAWVFLVRVRGDSESGLIWDKRDVGWAGTASSHLRRPGQAHGLRQGAEKDIRRGASPRAYKLISGGPCLLSGGGALPPAAKKASILATGNVIVTQGAVHKEQPRAPRLPPF